MPIPTVTALYASINAIYNVVLANNVSTLRRRDKPKRRSARRLSDSRNVATAV